MTRAVSSSDSPLESEEKVKPVVSQTRPPRREKAVWKLMRVRGAGLKEQVGHDRAVKGIAAVLTPRDGLEGVCDFEDSFEFAAVELVDGQDVSACKGHGFAPWEFAALYSGLRRDATRQGAQ